MANKGMQLLTSHHKRSSKESMQEDNEIEEVEEEDKEDDNLDPDYEEESRLTKKMNAATKKLQLSSVDGDQDKVGKDEGFDDANDREESINPNSDDKGGKDFSKDDLSVHQDNLTLGDEYDTASKVNSGVFDAIHSNKFEEPENVR